MTPPTESRDAAPDASESTEVLSPRMRVVAAICSIGLLAVAVGLPVLTWLRSGEGTGWGVWVAVAMASMVAAQCGRNLLRVARSGIGPRWIERDSL